jgi:hypothetical protein
MHRRHVGATCALAVLATIGLTLTLPGAYARWTTSGYDTLYPQFATWRTAIDHRRSVLWESDPVATWMVLDSPSYISSSQTAGVVFSRATAMEARRRAAVMQPFIGHSRFAIGRNDREIEKLTMPIARELCRDPTLGYIISTETLPLRHLDAPKGRFGEKKLYFCDAFREGAQ